MDFATKPTARTLSRTLCFILVSVSFTAVADERPNFVFFLADDVGQEVLGCYGGESYSTPNLDHLAKTGMRFQHCYSMPVCHPTRLTLMTGRYPFRYGNTKWGTFPKAAESKTFSSILAKAGYATAVAGKWQLTFLRNDPNQPYRLGFQLCDVFGWHEGPRFYQPMIYQNGRVREDTLGHYGPDLYVRSLIEFMKENRERPFFAYYPMTLCHNVSDDFDEPVPYGALDRYENYSEMVAEMDRAVGRIVAALNALKLREKTLILFIGDNGTSRELISRADEENKLVRVPVVSRQNGRDVPGGKGTLKDTGTRVPMIANWPKTIQAEQVVDDLVDMSDFWPTLLQLSGVDQPESDIDGVSFASRLTDNQASSREFAYSQKKDGSYWVRNAKWKLYGDGRLIDVANDPDEVTPVESTSESETQEARAKLQAAMDSLGRVTEPNE